MSSSFNNLIQLLLPHYILEHFELISFEQKQEMLHLYLEEINKPPVEDPVEPYKKSQNGTITIGAQDKSLLKRRGLIQNLIRGRRFS